MRGARRRRAKGARQRCQELAAPTDRRMPEAAAAAALCAALPRAAGLVGGLGAPGAQLCILAADAHFSACALCGSPGQSCPHGLHGAAPAHTGSPLPTYCPGKHVEGRGCCCDPRLRSEAPPRVPYRRWRERASSYPGGAPPSLRPTYWERTGQTSELCVWAFWVSALSRVARVLQPC